MLLPPLVITFATVIGISRLWKNGKLKFGSSSVTTSFFIFITGLIITMIVLGYSFTYFLGNIGIASAGRLFLSTISVAFMAIGTARTSAALPDRKFRKLPGGGYVAIGLLTLFSWILLALSVRLNPINQQMTFGLVLGTVFIFSAIAMAIYRRIVFGE